MPQQLFLPTPFSGRPGPPYTYYFESATIGITHNEPMIFSEKEFMTFLKKHNSYPDMMKLKFTLAMNLLTEGELI